MANLSSSRLLLLLSLTVAGCDLSPPASPQPDITVVEGEPDSPQAVSEANAKTSSEVLDAPPSTASPEAPPPSASYADAINRASAAFSLSQSARSKDDWRLTASRWQQAIALLETVPEGSPNYAIVPQKLAEYQQNLAYAQQQADVPIPEPAPGRVVLVPAQEPAQEPALSAPRQASAPSAPASAPRPSPRPSPLAPPAEAGRAPPERGMFQAPIVRRAGGTPVILATFNGGEPFEMIVDTGASGTVITQPMARALNVATVGEARVATASASSVPFQLGYVSSLEVAGVRIDNLLVAIAGPELSTGLLGQDFFSGYDITVRQSVVEFHER